MFSGTRLRLHPDLIPVQRFNHNKFYEMGFHPFNRASISFQIDRSNRLIVNYGLMQRLLCSQLLIAVSVLDLVCDSVDC